MLKYLPKILIISFLSIFIFQLTCLLFLSVTPSASLAAELKFKPQVGLPVQRQSGDTFDFSGKIENTFPKDGSTKPIAEYIRAIYKYAIGIVGILAAVVLMVGGVMWIVAGGSATMIGEAKAWIGASLTGLTLALLSYLILATVNPALVDLRTTAIGNVAPVAGITNFDISTPCGQQTQDQAIICGSKCPNGQTCEKVPRGTTNAKECPETLSSNGPNTGNGNYYLCSSLSGGGTNCCNSNDDSQCRQLGSEYICNMGISGLVGATGACASPKGTCSSKQGDSGSCDEDADCLNGFECNSKRCRATTAATEGVTCNSGSCAVPLKCIFNFPRAYPGVCYNGSAGDPCCYNSDCQSNNCSRPWYYICAVSNIYDYTCK